MSKIFIGVAWPYANGDIHVGHYGGSLLPADVFARYNRLKGNDVLMVSGSDMHGTAITVLAEQENKSPLEVSTYFHERNKKAIEKSGISFDIFTTTHTENHIMKVQEIFKVLYDGGYIIEKKVNSPYCEKCKRFLADRYIVGECPYCHSQEAKGNECDQCGKLLEPSDLINPHCKVCNSVPVYKEETELYLSLSKISDVIEKFLDDKKYWRPNVITFTQNFIKDGLNDRAITRELQWGVPVPLDNYQSKVIYVWFEALCGYLTASIEYSNKKGNGLWKEFWYNSEAKHYYFMGKDNIFFHTIFWPAILTEYDKQLQLPYDIPANEYVKMGAGKFSKSKGVSELYKIYNLVNSYPPDMLRFYSVLHMPENHDTNFEIDEMFNQYNQVLVNGYGNLIHRILSFYFAHFQGEITAPANVTGISSELEGCMEKVDVLISNCRFKEALESVVQLIIHGNKMFNDYALWDMVKKDRNETKKIMDDFVWLVKGLLILMHPFTPFSSETGLRYLYPSSYDKITWDEIMEPPELKITEKPVPLFARIKWPVEDIEINIRIGTIRNVLHVEGSDKLYRLAVSFDGESRNVIAGIKPYYSEDELMNKSVAVLYNLNEKIIKGIKSEGMLLAAYDGNHLSLIRNDELKSGDTIDSCSYDGTINIDQFKKYDIEVITVVKNEKGFFARSKKGMFPIDAVKSKYVGSKALMLHYGDTHILLKRGDTALILDRDVEEGAKVS